jgi:hypothetical protein
MLRAMYRSVEEAEKVMVLVRGAVLDTEIEEFTRLLPHAASYIGSAEEAVALMDWSRALPEPVTWSEGEARLRLTMGAGERLAHYSRKERLGVWWYARQAGVFLFVTLVLLLRLAFFFITLPLRFFGLWPSRRRY